MGWRTPALTKGSRRQTPKAKVSVPPSSPFHLVFSPLELDPPAQTARDALSGEVTPRQPFQGCRTSHGNPGFCLLSPSGPESAPAREAPGRRPEVRKGRGETTTESRGAGFRSEITAANDNRRPNLAPRVFLGHSHASSLTCCLRPLSTTTAEPSGGNRDLRPCKATVPSPPFTAQKEP